MSDLFFPYSPSPPPSSVPYGAYIEGPGNLNRHDSIVDLTSSSSPLVKHSTSPLSRIELLEPQFQEQQHQQHQRQEEQHYEHQDQRQQRIASPTNLQSSLSSTSQLYIPVSTDFTDFEFTERPTPRIRNSNGYAPSTRLPVWEPPVEDPFPEFLHDDSIGDNYDSNDNNYINQFNATNYNNTSNIQYDSTNHIENVENNNDNTMYTSSSSHKRRRSPSESHLDQPFSLINSSPSTSSNNNRLQSTVTNGNNNNIMNNNNKRERIEVLDLIDVEESSTAGLQQMLQSQQAQDKPEGEDGTRRRIADFKCVICLDDPTDLSATLCGHLFCNECIKLSLSYNGNAVGRNAGRCPVCRGRLSVKDVIPLELKLFRKADKGKQRTKMY